MPSNCPCRLALEVRQGYPRGGRIQARSSINVEPRNERRDRDWMSQGWKDDAHVVGSVRVVDAIDSHANTANPVQIWRSPPGDRSQRDEAHRATTFQAPDLSFAAACSYGALL